MNNPDEETAEAQFGKGDKYFGVTVLLVTMPGLPMFGHGQVEGYKEKYGMEYRRAYWNESVDDALVDRHAREIFPLLRKRYLFSGAVQFAMFDFVAQQGHVNENIFAYSNRAVGERALIVYNNAYDEARGVVHTSTAMNRGTAEEKELVRVSLGAALGLNGTGLCYYIFRDYRTGLEYLRPGKALAEEGLHLALNGYQYYAFLDWREVHDLDGAWAQLHGELGGGGVPDVMEAYEEMHLAPILEPFRRVFNSEMLARLGFMAAGNGGEQEFRAGMGDFLVAVGGRLGKSVDTNEILDAIERDPDCRYNLVGVLYAREEGPFADSEMPRIIEAASDWFDRTDLAVCMEPTDNQLELGCLPDAAVDVGQEGHGTALGQFAPLLLD